MKKILSLLAVLSSVSALADYTACTAKCSFTNTPVAVGGSWNVAPPETYELGDVTVSYIAQSSYENLVNRLKDACQQEVIQQNLHLIPSLKSYWNVYSSTENSVKSLGSQSEICK